LQVDPSCSSILDMTHVVAFGSGSPSDSETVPGLVLLGVNVAHRKMRTVVDTPRVLLLENARLYPNTAPSMTSLRSLRSSTIQEIQSQSQAMRIISARPDIVIMPDPISIDSQLTYQRHGVTVVAGVTHRQIVLLARATNATPVTSLRHAQLATCRRFQVTWEDLPPERRYESGTQRRVSCLKLNSAAPDRFLTLILRGVQCAVDRTALESITRTAVLIAYNTTLEASYIFDSNATLYQDLLLGTPPISPGSDRDLGNRTAGPLSSTPLVLVDSRVGGDLVDRDETDDQLMWSLEFGVYWMHAETPVGTRYVSCFRPLSTRTAFYGANDTTIGEFLRNTCFNASRKCRCGRTMLNHKFCVTHANGKLSIEVDALPQALLAESSDDATLSWVWCQLCRRRSSAVVRVSGRTLAMSITKFFELCIYDYRVRSQYESCRHRVHRDMIRCFAFRNLVASITYTTAPPFQLSFALPMRFSGKANARLARVELARLLALAHHVSTIALRHTNRRLPSLVIDSSGDVVRRRIQEQYDAIVKRAAEYARMNVGPTIARQLYVQLFQAANLWKSQVEPEYVRSADADPVAAVTGFLGGSPAPVLVRNAIWTLSPTFGGTIIPIIPLQVCTQIAHALASLQHAAFIMSVSDVPTALKLLPLEKVLSSSMLGVEEDNEARACEQALRVKPIVDHDYSTVVDCGQQGTCRIHFARQFQALRHCVCQNNYTVIESLSRSKVWAATGGKSNAAFRRTGDRRLILKRISSTEAKAFSGMAFAYFRYMADHLFGSKPSCLIPIIGLFEITSPPSSTSVFHVLMPNLFAEDHVDRIFDLKGKSTGRFIPEKTAPDGSTSVPDWEDLDTNDLGIAPPAHNEQVLQDENFAMYMNGEPLPLIDAAYDALFAALGNDTKFLSSLGIMDYSVLLGVCEGHPRQIIIGIIDYIRTYTLDKKVETTIKTFVERGTPTVVPPVLYMERFLAQMYRNFISTPHRERQWGPMRSGALDVDPAANLVYESGPGGRQHRADDDDAMHSVAPSGHHSYRHDILFYRGFSGIH
ncbi:hypothetical protein PBRA_000321, partial [Plasmodiophora brassicae]